MKNKVDKLIERGDHYYYVKGNFIKADRLYDKAIEEGSALAIYAKAQIYYENANTKSKFLYAFGLFEQSYEKGYGIAILTIETMRNYYFKKGKVKKNIFK